jgi:two-component system LytT family sensor kinase
MLSAGAVGPYVAGNLIGFSIGLVISILLLALTLRAARLPGTPVANIALAVCSLLWNVGGLADILAISPGSLNSPDPGSIALAIQFTGAAVWPIPMLVIWHHLAQQRWQCICWRFLQVLAFASAAVIVTGIWAAAAGAPFLPIVGLKEFSAYDATFLQLSAAALLLRGSSVSRTLGFSSLVVLVGLLLTTLSVIVERNVTPTDSLQCALGVTGQQSVLLIVIGTFFLFARFRFADVFIRYSVRILLAGVSAATFVLLIDSSFVERLGVHASLPGAMRFFVMAIAAAGLVMCFVPLDRRLERLVNRRVFHAPDYRNAVRELGEQVRRLYSESEVTVAVEAAVRNTLDLDDVRSVALSRLPVSLWPAGMQDGEVAELGRGNPLASLLSLNELELLVPVHTEGRVHSVLAISPGVARRSLVSQELNYLRSVAQQFGSRLDLLRLERDMVERQNREALLLQQVTEAELRALRAQINPHFLFNSLNTIANLIVTDAAQAEVMTLRLAKVFRHLLAHSSRTLVPIREEIEFLRTYLDIEEARFGSRLEVQIDISPEVAHTPVPSLILQPVVENALKHGVGPKIGPGRLWISARPEGDRICLSVEDDGVGVNSGGPGTANGHGDQNGGVGLRNIRQRLVTLYQDRARLTLEPRDPEGTRVNLLLPRDAEWNGDDKPDR